MNEAVKRLIEELRANTIDVSEYLERARKTKDELNAELNNLESILSATIATTNEFEIDSDEIIGEFKNISDELEGRIQETNVMISELEKYAGDEQTKQINQRIAEIEAFQTNGNNTIKHHNDVFESAEKGIKDIGTFKES
ncbi:hypothetical protein K4U16_11860 [Staphylococcus epidermidis]|nr:hypothetical protein [Staphylococcus epidermidis]